MTTGLLQTNKHLFNKIVYISTETESSVLVQHIFLVFSSFCNTSKDENLNIRIVT